MTLRLTAAIALLSAFPAYAQTATPPAGNQNAPKPTVAEVQAVVTAIQGDKAKSAQYCDMMKLYDEAAQAEEKKDAKMAQDLTQKADDIGKKLGTDYDKLMTGLQSVDPSSTEGQELSKALDPLDSTCPSGGSK